MGKHKYIESPEKMWELFVAYKEKTKSNPIREHDFLGGKELHEVRREKERPLTMEGFENYVADQSTKEKPMPMELSHYFANSDGDYTDFLAICARIKKAIRQDQIEGGMAGIYNPSITQRLNNLTEKTETTIKEQPLFPDEDV